MKEQESHICTVCQGDHGMWSCPKVFDPPAPSPETPKDGHTFVGRCEKCCAETCRYVTLQDFPPAPATQNQPSEGQRIAATFLPLHDYISPKETHLPERCAHCKLAVAIDSALSSERDAAYEKGKQDGRGEAFAEMKARLLKAGGIRTLKGGK